MISKLKYVFARLDRSNPTINEFIVMDHHDPCMPKARRDLVKTFVGLLAFSKI